MFNKDEKRRFKNLERKGVNKEQEKEIIKELTEKLNIKEGMVGYLFIEDAIKKLSEVEDE